MNTYVCHIDKYKLWTIKQDILPNIASLNEIYYDDNFGATIFVKATNKDNAQSLAVELLGGLDQCHLLKE